MKRNKLILARKEKKITQSKMAEMLFMSQSQYQRRECGKIHISNDEWMRISSILNKDIYELNENAVNIPNHNNNIDNYQVLVTCVEMLKEEIVDLRDEINIIKEALKML